METTKIIRHGIEVVLLEFVPDWYLIHEQANKALVELRKGIKTWVSLEVYQKMHISLWIYDNLTEINAFCYSKNNQNYIALSTGLLFAIFNTVEEFIDQERFSLVFKLGEDKKVDIMEALALTMLNFTVAHEFGHIAHGHLRNESFEGCFDEMLYISGGEDDRTTNWNTQLKEYDADSVAMAIQSLLLLQAWDKDADANAASVDVLFIAHYLSFRIFAKKTGRAFDLYMQKEIDEFDHPHPGIRMFYSVLLCSYWVDRIKGYTEDVLHALSSGMHAVIAYERMVLEKQEIKECYFSVAFTEKGCQHIMNLNNCWQDLVDQYGKYAYIPIEKLDNIESLPVCINEDGTIYTTGRKES